METDSTYQLSSIKKENMEPPSGIAFVTIKTELIEEKLLMNSSHIEPVDFDKLRDTVKNSLCQSIPIKNEFVEPPLDIKLELIQEDLLIDDTDIDMESLTDIDPLTIAEHKNQNNAKTTANNKKRKGNGEMDPNRKVRADCGRFRWTSYTLWCKEKRQELLSTHPGLDFASISRKLGEMWRNVSRNEKYNLKRRAKRLTRKLHLNEIAEPD